MASVLGNRQQEDLDRAILAYLEENNHTAAFEALKLSTRLVSDEKSAGLLTKRWRAVMALQKQIFTLEEEIKQLKEEAKSGGTLKINTSVNLPRAPARRELRGHRGAVLCVKMHPRYNVVVTCAEDAIIKIWNADSGQCECSLRGHTDAVTYLSFNANGTLLASASADSSVRIWSFDNTTFACRQSLQGHDHTVSGCVFIPNCDALASCSRDNTVKVWDLASGYCKQTLRGHGQWVKAVAVNPAGTVLVSASVDRSLRLWDLQTGELMHECKEHEHVVECVAFSTASADTVLAPLFGAAPKSVEKKLSVEEKRALLRAKREGVSVSSTSNTANNASNSPPAGGMFVVSGSRDNSLRVWAVATGLCVLTLSGHSSWVRSVCFHPSGQFIISSGDDSSVRVWNLKDGRQEHELVAAHAGHVASIDCGLTVATMASCG